MSVRAAVDAAVVASVDFVVVVVDEVDVVDDVFFVAR